MILFFISLTIIGRFLSVFFIEGIFRRRNILNLKEIFFISFGGTVKGAIAIGLIQKTNKSTDKNYLLIITILSVVIFTSVIFGSLIPLVHNFLFADSLIEKNRLNNLPKI